MHAKCKCRDDLKGLSTYQRWGAGSLRSNDWACLFRATNFEGLLNAYITIKTLCPNISQSSIMPIWTSSLIHIKIFQNQPTIVIDMHQGGLHKGCKFGTCSWFITVLSSTCTYILSNSRPSLTRQGVVNLEQSQVLSSRAKFYQVELDPD